MYLFLFASFLSFFSWWQFVIFFNFWEFTVLYFSLQSFTSQFTSQFTVFYFTCSNDVSISCVISNNHLSHFVSFPVILSFFLLELSLFLSFLSNLKVEKSQNHISFKTYFCSYLCHFHEFKKKILMMTFLVIFVKFVTFCHFSVISALSHFFTFSVILSFREHIFASFCVIFSHYSSFFSWWQFVIFFNFWEFTVLLILLQLFLKSCHF